MLEIKDEIILRNLKINHDEIRVTKKTIIKTTFF